jgi:NodT family efflux transporter outer membrane factor (OMF) lipoprotein
MSLRMRLTSSAVIALLSACTVGPNFHRPAPPATDDFTIGDPPTATVGARGQGGEAQHFNLREDVPTEWWTLFRCAALNRLVQEALANSPTLVQARARLLQAREEFNAQSGATRYPAIDTQAGVIREKVDPAAFGIPNVPNVAPFTLYNAQVNVAYTLDLFGAGRRALEKLQAQTDYAAFEAAAARLTVAANVVTAAIRQAALETQVAMTGQLLEAQAQQLAITDSRYQAGGVARQDLNSQRTAVAQTQASLPPLRAQRQQIDHQLAVLTGKPPALAAIPQFSLDELHLPTELPLTLPSELVRRRPDVRASEAIWHQASADIGVATANLFPQIAVSGGAGVERTHLSELADDINVWNIGARLTQPIFHGGELRARKRAADAAYAAAAAAYQQTVLQALQQVADSLRALQADAQTLEAQSEAAQHAEMNYRIAQQRHAAGGISRLALLDAQRQKLQTALDRSRAQAARHSDSVALLQSLGGDWADDREKL